MGGLRFRVDGGPFLDDDAALATPPWTRLRELEAASLRLEQVGVEVERRRAEAILDEVLTAVSTWRSEATACGIPRAEQERMEEAFRGVE